MKNSTGKNKLYYSIGEVAEMFDVNQSLIRYWEKEFAIIRPRKNKKGNRLFREKDIENFHMIYHLVKEQGMTLKGAKMRLQKYAGETQFEYEIYKRLINIRIHLVRIKEQLKEE